jgi:hypothetical protein
MLFLVEYDRKRGKLVSMKSFSSAARRAAEQARLDLELDLNRKGVSREIVLLEASNEQALRRTHRRYFEDLGALLTPKVL